MIVITDKEIYSDADKYVHRLGTDAYFKRCTKLPNDTAEKFEEVDEIPSPEISEAIAQKIAEIDAYDKSEAVNSFTLDGERIWLDKDTRVGLMNSTNIQKASGQENTTLWFEGKSYTLPCDTAIQMLSALELYALNCYNVTAQHKANVHALKTEEEIISYDYTVGYPEKLNLKTSQQ